MQRLSVRDKADSPPAGLTSIRIQLKLRAPVNPTAPTPVRPAFSRFRWVIVVLLFLATTINYMDRQVLALLKPVLDVELGWSNEDYGKVHAAFFGVYAVSYAAFGWFIDRFGVRIGYAVSIFWWSLAAISHALARSAAGFLYARIGLGAGEGGNFPACIKAVAMWFPKRERAFAASLFNAGANVGPIIAPMIVPWIARHYGWRMAFVALGAAGLAWLVLWLPFYRDAPKQSGWVSAAEVDFIESDQEEQTSSGVNWMKLFSHRQTWGYVLLKFLTDPISWFYLLWLPDFFNKRHLDADHSWPLLVVIYLIAALLSIVGGWFSGVLIKRGWSPTWARKSGLLVSAACVVPVLAAPFASDWTVVIIVGLAIAAHQAWSANLYAAVSDIFPKRAVSAIAGIGGCFGAIGGMVFPYVAGRLLDHYSNAPGKGYMILFAICPTTYFIAFAINHALSPRFEQIDLETPRSQA